MDFNVRTTDLLRLNSLTKYPSIPTYHTLDPSNGGLLEEHIDFSDEDVIVTEKVDGTNARIILLPDGSYILGSREELLYAQRDLIGNPALGIVETLKPVAEKMSGHFGRMTICYLEVFGGKVTGAGKQYTGSGALGYRLFDTLDIDEYDSMLAKPPHEISALRDSPEGIGRFHTESELAAFAEEHALPIVPRLERLAQGMLPDGIEKSYRYLRDILPVTRCALDDAAGMKPEGIVIRTINRSQIAKLRFQDYERTLRRKGSL